MVASLLDKAPNLAGLSRTCEVPPHPSLGASDKELVRGPCSASERCFSLIHVHAEGQLLPAWPVHTCCSAIAGMRHMGKPIIWDVYGKPWP